MSEAIEQGRKFVACLVSSIGSLEDANIDTKSHVVKLPLNHLKELLKYIAELEELINNTKEEKLK